MFQGVPPARRPHRPGERRARPRLPRRARRPTPDPRSRGAVPRRPRRAHRRVAPRSSPAARSQRVAIARAVVGRPAVLLCDEPPAASTPRPRGVVLDLLDGFVADGLTVVVVTHDEQVAARPGRRIAISDGMVTERPAGRRPRLAGTRGRRADDRPGDRPDRVGRVRARDVVVEACVGAASRPGRSLLTAVGTILGVGTLVVTLGLAATASAQVNQRFDAVTPPPPRSCSPTRDRPRTAHPRHSPPTSRHAWPRWTASSRRPADPQVDHAPSCPRSPAVRPSVRPLRRRRRLPVYAAAPERRRSSRRASSVGGCWPAVTSGPARRSCCCRPRRPGRSVSSTRRCLAQVTLDGVPFDVVGSTTTPFVTRRRCSAASCRAGRRARRRHRGADDLDAGADQARCRNGRRPAGPVTPHSRTTPPDSPRPPPPTPRCCAARYATTSPSRSSCSPSPVCCSARSGTASTTGSSPSWNGSPRSGCGQPSVPSPSPSRPSSSWRAGSPDVRRALSAPASRTAGVVLVAVTQGSTPVLSMPLVVAAAACGTLTGLAAGVYPPGARPDSPR